MYESITLDIEANIAVLTLNRLAVMNAMSTQMRADILHAIRQSASAAGSGSHWFW